MTKRKLIVISHDAMVQEDLQYLGKLPTFSYLLQNGAHVQTLRTIYPSLTYPVHVSIASGVYPNRHGIINNERLEVGKLKSDWHWFSESVKVPTLFSIAKEVGLSTAAVFWPVTGNDPNIDFLINEYWTQSESDTLEDAFRRTGSNELVMERVLKHNLLLLAGNERKHPQADEFVVASACDMIRAFKPDVLMLHPSAIDGERHRWGLFSKKVNKALDHTERWTRMIIDAAKDAGVFEETNFVILSDHGQLEIKRTINLNVIFRDHGLLQTDEEGELIDWTAYSKSAALSAQVYLKPSVDQVLYDRVYKLLCSLRDEGIYGISEVFTREEINVKEHLDGDFSFIVESDGYTSFGNDWRRPLVRPYDLTDYRFGRATHGHLPDKGPQPTMIAFGPSFKKNVITKRRPIVDIAPTLARSIGLTFSDVDGTLISDILQD